MNVLWRSLARMLAKLIFLLSVAGSFGTLAYASEGIITTVAGKVDINPVNDDRTTFFSGDGGLAINAQLNQPADIAVDNRGNIYIADWGNQRIRKIDITGNISTIAGSDDWRATDWLSYGSSNSATSISIGLPSSIIVVNDKDEVYISDEDNHRVYQMLIDGTINVIAGSGTTDGGFSGDGGLAIHAQLGYPSGLAIDNNSNLYVADSRNHRVRKIDTSGIISTVAGNGSEGFSGDGGLAINAQLDWPNDIAFDKNGNLYIADSGNNRVRKVDLTSNTISTVAGNGATDGIIDTWDGEDTGGFSGDGGLAIHAQFNYPTSIAFDKDNNLYISDLFNNRIRRVDTAGTIVTVAGSDINWEDTQSNGDGGKATEAKLLKPKGIAVDNNNNLFIADMSADRVRKVTFSNSTVNQECREVLTEITTSEGSTEITRETYCKGEDGKWHFLNLSPTADFYISPGSSGQAPLTINLDATPSSDSDGFIISYQWLVNGQILTGKIVSVTLEKAGNYSITLTVADDKGATNTKTNAITVTQPSNAFCTSGSANVNNLNCVNGNCSGVKISCNSKSCQWCDGSNNCGNILYDGTTSIPNGSITCNKGRCNYKTQIGGSSSSGSFSCKTSEPFVIQKVEAVNPVVSQPIYQNGDTIKITIPATAPAGQTQYFGVGLPDNLGLFLADNLNQFHPFDGINLLEWQGGETAVEVPVTQALPRGTYNAYLLRSSKGINPLTANPNQTALGTADFVVMDEVNPHFGGSQVLNDTGITWGGGYPSGNNSTCEGELIKQQDCAQGRDATHNDDSDGHAGFSFTKIDGGNCVQDNVTGLMWEVKTNDGGLHDKDDRYTWYNTDSTTNGGSNGFGGSEYNYDATCYGYQPYNPSTYCNTQEFVARVNAAGWCGYHDWRMPNLEELRSIVDYGRSGPSIDTVFFPNTQSRFWSGSPNPGDSFVAAYIHFYDGDDGYDTRDSHNYVQLVRGGQ